MTIAVDPKVRQLAKNVQAKDGIDYRVVESQWKSEEGTAGILTSLSDWKFFNNNPAGMKWGTDAPADQYATGTTKDGFLVFATPQDGASAYAAQIASDSNYSGLRAAIGTHNVANELEAIAYSPWDTNHYQGDTNVPGNNLADSYAAITGQNSTTILAAMEASNHGALAASAQTVGDSISGIVPRGTIANQGGAALASLGKNATTGSTAASELLGKIGINTIIVIVGILMIAFLLYRTVTH